jgi:hypothetical protein
LPLVWPEGPNKPSSWLWGGVLCRILQTNFHEKAHFVKADLAAHFGIERNGCVSFAMLPSALLVSPLLADSVHCEIHLFGL